MVYLIRRNTQNPLVAFSLLNHTTWFSLRVTSFYLRILSKLVCDYRMSDVAMSAVR